MRHTSERLIGLQDIVGLPRVSGINQSLLLPINSVNHHEAPAILPVSLGEAKSLPFPCYDVAVRKTRNFRPRLTPRRCMADADA